ncbi:unnamed protein product, partial [Musa textilis]
ARDWSEQQLVGTFIEELNLDIRCEVKARQPRTMVVAISFARIQEEKINMEYRQNRSDNKQMISVPPGLSIPNHNLNTREELKESSAKGLCSHCDERWSKEHHCRQGKLLRIEPIEEKFKAEELDFDQGSIETDKDIDPITYTVHALAGYSNPQTMQVVGTLKHQPVTILIDTGSTNNFMDRKIATRLSYHIDVCDKFEVKVANGRILTCNSQCSMIQLTMQGQELLVDFFLLPLEDYEVVLGIEWLSTLGDVSWNFSNLIMKFFVNGKQVILK